MNLDLEFHFDFASPNAFLAWRVLPGIEERTGQRFRPVPVLLGGVFKATNNVPPMVANQGIRNKTEYIGLEIRRFVARHGIEGFRFNPHFPVNTLALMRGATAALREGRIEPYMECCFRAMWCEERKLDDPEVIVATLDAAGLDGRRLLELGQDDEVKKQLRAATDDSVERGAFGIPTFFVEGEIYFGKDSLDDVEREIRARLAGGR